MLKWALRPKSGMSFIFTESEALAELVGHYDGSEVAFVRLDFDCRIIILMAHTMIYPKLLYKLIRMFFLFLSFETMDVACIGKGNLRRL